MWLRGDFREANNRSVGHFLQKGLLEPPWALAQRLFIFEVETNLDEQYGS